MKFSGSFGSWLKQRRKALDLTQQDLAEQVGYSVATIRKIEGDVWRPSRQITERLAESLVISSDEQAAFVAFARQIATPSAAAPAQPSPREPSHTLPPQLTPFVGRTQELAQIAGRLDNPVCRLLTLVGSGGIGKTRLALQAAANRVERHADGAYFVSLASVALPGSIASAIASALKVSLHSAEDPASQIVSHLREKDLLLALDNFEHLLEGVGFLTDLLTSAPRVKVLVTSRERLNLQEEWVLVVDGLNFPDAVTVDELAGYDAIQLFMQRAGQIQPDFSLSENQAAVVAICQYLEGMPLGIELAAPWLRIMSCPQIAERLQRDLDFLSTPLRNVPERHRSLRRVFEQSWNLLSEMERWALAALSIFRGGFDLDAAEQVAGASLDILASLLDQSLVRVSGQRYDLHELLRQFAEDKLQESGETAHIASRHLDYFLGLGAEFDHLILGAQRWAWFERMQVDLDNLRAALEASVQLDRAEVGLQLASVLNTFWDYGGHYREGYAWLERLLGLATDASASVRVRALWVAGEAMGHLDDTQKAAALCEQSLALARETGDKRNVAHALGSLAFVVLSRYDYRRARDLGEEALTLFREIDDKRLIQLTLQTLGKVETLVGHYERATQMFNEALAVARELDDRGYFAWTLYFSTNLDWYQTGDIERATRQYQECLSVFQDIQILNGLAWTLWGLGTVARAQGQYERARVFAQESLTLNQKTYTEGAIIHSFCELAAAARKLGDQPFAQKLLDEAIRRSAAIKDPWRTARCLAGLAGLALDRNHTQRAATLFGTAYHDLTVSGALYPTNRAEYETDIAIARTQLGEEVFAIEWAKGQAMTQEQAIAYALQRDTGPGV